MCKPREKRETKLVIRSDTRFVPMLHHPEDVAGERRLASKSYVSLHYHFAGHLPLTSTLKQIAKSTYRNVALIRAYSDFEYSIGYK